MQLSPPQMAIFLYPICMASLRCVVDAKYHYQVTSGQRCFRRDMGEYPLSVTLLFSQHKFSQLGERFSRKLLENAGKPI